MSPLAQSIYKTLAFFDAQDMALTLMEVGQYLVAHNPSLPPLIRLGGGGAEKQVPPLRVRGGEGELLSEIEQTLRTELAGRIEYQDGFYFLRGRPELLDFRKARYKISLKRLRKCQKYLWPLRLFPYLRAVAISGSLGLLNSDKLSDIDLFVITKKNRIWLTRLLVSLYFQILGQRRYGKRVANRFCLNHYLSEGVKISQDQNLYTAAEYMSLIPVLGEEVLQKFLQENVWVKSFLENPYPETANSYFGFSFSLAQKIFEVLLDYTIASPLNWLSGLFQKQRIKMQEHILVSDNELSFHPGSRGQKVLARFQAKI